jgi:signal transduction histidine kinase
VGVSEPEPTEAVVAADELDGRVGEIMRRFDTAMRAAGSPLAEDRETWPECLRQAGFVLADCVRGMRVGQVAADEEQAAQAAKLAVLCGHRGIPAREPARMWAELLAAAVRTLADPTAAGPAVAPERLSAVTAMLHRCVRARTTTAVPTEYVALHRVREIHAADRGRLAREIHDWLGNHISLAVRHLELYEIYQGTGNPRAGQEVAQARTVLNEVLAEARRLVADLRPQPPVTDLATAIGAFVRAAYPPSITVRVEVTGPADLVPGNTRQELFLVIREALRNTLSHSRANSVVVLVTTIPGQVHAVVQDHGVGFDVDAVAAGGRGYGLVSMRERTELLGGTFVLSSAPGRGTRLEIRVPLMERNYVDDNADRGADRGHPHR